MDIDWHSPALQKSLAIHEAGHAVVAWRCDMKVEFLKLEYGLWSGELKSGYVWLARDDGWEEKAQSYAATYAAGAVAQERYLLEIGVDASLAARIAERSGVFDQDDMVDMVRDFGVSPLEAHTRAVTLVEANMDLVLLVGDLLFERGRVTGSVAR